MPHKKGDDKYTRIIETAKKTTAEGKDVRVEDVLVKVVIFTLCDNSYAFYGHSIKSILPYKTVNPVPGCPDYILGIVNIRGDIESVININHFMGLASETVDSRSRIVIAEGGGIRSGILVGSVEDVVDVPAGSILPSISTIENSIKEFVEGELDYDGSLVTVLNVDELFGRITI